MAGQRRITRDKAGAGRPTRQSTGRGKKSLLDARRDFLSKRPCARLYRKGIEYNEMTAWEAMRKKAAMPPDGQNPMEERERVGAISRFNRPRRQVKTPSGFQAGESRPILTIWKTGKIASRTAGTGGLYAGEIVSQNKNRFLAASSPGNPQDFSGNRRRLGRRRIHRILRFHPRRNGHGSNFNLSRGAGGGTCSPVHQHTQTFLTSCAANARLLPASFGIKEMLAIAACAFPAFLLRPCRICRLAFSPGNRYLTKAILKEGLLVRQKTNAIFAFAPAVEKAVKLLFREALSDERALVLCKIAGLLPGEAPLLGQYP